MARFAVFFGPHHAGELSSERARLRLTYSFRTRDAESRPLSVRLPLRRAPYENEQAHPYFSNLLPEDEHRRLLAAELRLDSRQVGPLLGAIGGECAGAVSIWPDGQAPDRVARYVDLSDRDFARLVSDDGAVERRAVTRAGRLSLPGGMDKLALRKGDAGWQRPKPGAPTTHILKWAPPAYKDLSINEHVTLDLLRRAGLPVVESELLPTAPRVIVVRRFDRVEARDGGGIALLHQEDLCQAMGVEPAFKYQSDGGPGLADAAKVLRTFSAVPASEVSRLLDWVLASFLVGSTDGHAKTLSFVHYDDGISLSPIYDMSCAAVYPGLKKLAMSIGGEYRLAYVRRRHWERLAEVLGVRWNAIRVQGDRLAENLEQSLDAAREANVAAIGDLPLLRNMQRVVQAQIARLRGSLSQSKTAS